MLLFCSDLTVQVLIKIYVKRHIVYLSFLIFFIVVRATNSSVVKPIVVHHGLLRKTQFNLQRTKNRIKMDFYNISAKLEKSEKIKS